MIVRSRPLTRRSLCQRVMEETGMTADRKAHTNNKYNRGDGQNKTKRNPLARKRNVPLADYKKPIDQNPTKQNIAQNSFQRNDGGRHFGEYH